MHCDLSAEQIRSYRENGFVVHRGLLDANEVDHWRDVMSESIARLGHRQIEGDPRSAEELAADDGFYRNVFEQKMNLWKVNPAMRELILDPRIGRMCCELEGIDGIRVWHDQALVKKPWANPTSFHLDNPYWSFHSPHSISIWVALDSVNPQNGCLYFLPGTHRSAKYEITPIGENFGSLFKAYPEWASIEPAFAELEPGDCTFHNGLLAHGAGANATPRERRAMTCAFMPEGSTFNGQQNILPPELYKSYEVGDRLADESHNPLVWPAAGHA